MALNRFLGISFTSLFDKRLNSISTFWLFIRKLSGKSATISKRVGAGFYSFFEKRFELGVKKLFHIFVLYQRIMKLLAYEIFKNFHFFLVLTTKPAKIISITVLSCCVISSPLWLPFLNFLDCQFHFERFFGIAISKLSINKAHCLVHSKECRFRQP